MASAWLTNFLASLDSPTSQSRQPTTQEMASNIIRRSNRYGYNLPKTGQNFAALATAAKKSEDDDKGPSNIQRVMDIISRPLYGTMEGIKQDIKHGGLIDKPHFGPVGDESGEFGEIVKGGALGWAGKRKTTSRDVYKAAGMGEGKGVGGFIRNFATDVLLDPLNVVPFGWAAKAARAGRSGTKAAVEASEEAARASKVGTATERVEQALKFPKAQNLGTSARNTYAPKFGQRQAPSAPGKNDPARTFTPEYSGPAGRKQPLAITDNLDPAMRRVRQTGPQYITKGFLPGGAAKMSIVKPNTKAKQTLDNAPDLWKQLLKGAPIPAKFTPKKIKESLAKVVPVDAPLPKPKAAAPVETAAGKKFMLDHSKVAAIEIARATSKKTKQTSKEYTSAKKLIDENGDVPVYEPRSGDQTGVIKAAHLNDYLLTGKAKIPKESEIPDMTGWSNQKADEFWAQYMVPDKDTLTNLFIKNVDENDNVTLRSLAVVRKEMLAEIKKRKIPKVAEDEIIEAAVKATDDIPAAAVADEIPTATSDTVVDEFSDLEDFKIADAEDIVEAVGEGSEVASKAMMDAVEAQRPRSTQLIDEQGGRAIAKTTIWAIDDIKAKKWTRYPTFNPAKQANAARRLEGELVKEGKLTGFKAPQDKLITTSTGKIAQRRRSEAMKHLEALEDAMTAAGYPPMTFGKDGFPLRMSDLINSSGGIHAVLGSGIHLTDLFGNGKKLDEFLASNPEAAQLAEKSKAAHAAYTADLVEKGKSAALSAASKAELDPSKTASEVAEALAGAPKVAADVVKASMDLPNPQAVRMAAQSTKEMLKEAQPPIVAVTQKHRSVLTETIQTGKITPNTVKAGIAQEKAALTVAGLDPAAIRAEVSLADDSLQSQSLMASLGKAFIPDFLQKDLRPIAVQQRSLFQQHTSYWSHALNVTFKKYDKAQRIQGWTALTKGHAAGDDVSVAAGEEFRKAMTSMFEGSGLNRAITSDVERMAITMDDLNAAAKIRGYDFRFTKEVTDELGNTIPIQWTDSWKYADLKGRDPIEFVKQMRDIVDKTMLEKSMFDQIATLWGKPVGRSFKDIPRLKGVMFDQEILPQIRQFMNVMEELNKPRGKLRLQWEQILRIWKTSVTIYSPSHHIRNMFGDTTLAWLQGVNNPVVYKKGMQVLKAKRNLYSDLNTVDNLLSPDAMAKQLARDARVPIVRVAGRTLDAEQVHSIMYSNGLLPHSKVLEDIHGTAAVDVKLPKPLKGRGAKVARGVSESREHFSRSAHFVDALGKSKAKTMEEAIKEATAIVRKWHPDGLDLAPFEEKWMRNIFPFYSWMRKAVPLLLEGAVKKPAKIIAPNKALYNLQVSMGIDPESMSEPFPVDKDFPDWIRDMAYGPVLGGGTHTIGSNLNPFTSVGEQLLNDPRRGIAGMLNPGVRIPGEIMSQNVWQTGQDFDDMDTSEYIDKQIPGVSILNRLTGGNLAAGSVEALATGNKDAMLDHKVTDKTEGNSARRDALFNYLVAAGIINTQSPANITAAEFDRRDRVAASNKKAREAAAK